MTGERVNFRIRDCYHPEPRSILEARFGDNLLQGKVVDYVSRSTSDRTTDRDVYAVVEVSGMSQLVLVAKRFTKAAVPGDPVR